MTYKNATDEPLSVIEANECHGADLTSRRVRQLFNHIHKQDEELDRLRAIARAVRAIKIREYQIYNGTMEYVDVLDDEWVELMEALDKAGY